MSRIPRHFHFVFGLRPQTEPFHVVYYLCLESCLRVNRPERLTVHLHHEPHGPWWDRIRGRIEVARGIPSEHVRDEAYRGHEREFSYAHHADFIRLDRLIEHGGVYADMDTLFVRPYPDEWFREESCVLGREAPVPASPGAEPRPSVCNAVILAERGAPFLRAWREAMPREFDGSWSRHSCDLAHRLAAERAEWVRVVEEEAFYPFMWTVGDLRALLEERREPPAGAYSVHLWNHLWWDARRTDFSAFNQERLTPRFIRGGGNTYAWAARRFLPPRSETGGWRADMEDLARECWARRDGLRRLKRAVFGRRAPCKGRG